MLKARRIAARKAYNSRDEVKARKAAYNAEVFGRVRPPNGESAIYGDFAEIPALAGEGRCASADVLAIKAHPEHLNVTRLRALLRGACSVERCVCGGGGAQRNERLSGAALHQMSIDMAYDSVRQSVMCEMWSNIKHHATRYGYAMWNGIRCPP